MPPAIIGGVIAGAGAIGAAAIGSSATKNAAKQSAQQASEDRALQERTYAKNEANLTPFMARGNAAGDAINALLGLGAAPAAVGNAPAGTPGALNYYDGDISGLSPLHAAFARIGQQQPALPAPAPAAPAKNAAQAASEAYEIFKQSTGYQTRLDEGYRGINSAYAAKGTLQSGAALKSALRYGQDYASNEFGNYLGYLGNQQGVGLSGASALAGVGQNYANSMSAIGQNNANLQAQATIAGARNTQGALAGLAGIAGQTVGALSSYNPSVYSQLTPSAATTIAQNPAIF